MINDYAELITEAAHRTGVTDVASRAKMYVGMAEKALSRRLRVADMEAETTLTTDNPGRVDLPDDYIAARAVFVNKAELPRKSFSQIRQERACGYVIQGSVLHSSERETDHDLAYYAAIPSLEANNTNWLLDAEPELYLQAVIFQIYTAMNDLEKVQATAGYLNTLIGGVARQDTVARYAGMKIAASGAPA
ncbi:phage adaptor protein [Tateyamaria sp.]|uniref:phage adaptor protein n=1 Tax=Tateyamaria sp. TaxID=1929288 RepID=UPI003B21451F